MKRILNILIVILVFILSSSVLAEPPADDTLSAIAANPIPDRDPVDLVIRLRGVDPTTVDYTPRPDYEVGDIETFNTGGTDETTSLEQREFVLAAKTDVIYLWVETELDYDPQAMADLAQEASEDIIPRLRDFYGPEDDIDNDPHVYVLNVGSIGANIAGVYFDTDTYPDEIFASSNEMNSLVMVRSILNDDEYLSVLAHEFQHMLQHALDDSEDTWMVEGMAELGSFVAAPDYYDPWFQQEYLDYGTPNQLTDWIDGDTSTYYGGASLFLIYLMQQYGEEVIQAVAGEPTDGVIGINQALAELQITDPATGEAVTFEDVFADFVIANYLNNPSVGDGRFAHTLLGIRDTAEPQQLVSDFPINYEGRGVAQYGTTYLELNSSDEQALTIHFEGETTANIIPARAYSGEYFYWSQAGNQGDARLTGRFDLSKVDSATLYYWAWYDMEEFWDYGYLSISGDGGTTWDVIETPNTTSENPYERAFAPGFTGNTATVTAEPAPYIGVELDSDTLTILTVQPETPASAADLQINDQMIAINGQTFTPDEYVPVLDQHRPGDTIVLTVIRNGQEVDVPITLAASPYRNSTNPSNWVQEKVDLTPYVGGEVLIRFDYVTDQALSLNGWAIDNIAIPELGFLDTAEDVDAAWTSEGWVRINNLVPQNYIVQLIDFGTQPPTVTRLLEPGDGVSGAWDITLNDRAVLAISGAAPVTTASARYDLTITER